METILIIDDYQPLLRLYEKEFTSEGYQVVAVNSIAEALPYIRERSFDAVIVEIGALCREEFETLMKGLLKEKNIPIIIINTGELDHRTTYLNRWVDAWVTKSSDLGPLKESIRVLKDKYDSGAVLCSSCRYYDPTDKIVGRCTLTGEVAWPKAIPCARFVLRVLKEAGGGCAEERR